MKTNFTVFNGLLYINTPDLRPYGSHKIFMFYEEDLLTNDIVTPNNFSKRFIVDQKIRDLALKAKEEPSVPVCLDIESWGLDNTNKETSLPKYLNVLKIFSQYNNVSKKGYMRSFLLRFLIQNII